MSTRSSAMAGRQLPLFSLIVPAWLVWVMAGWRGVIGVWPAVLVCGGSFAVVQFLVANYHGPWLVDVAGGLVSLVALALFLRVWQPRQMWHFPEEEPGEKETETATENAAAERRYTAREISSAWVPWVLLSVFVFVWGLPKTKDVLGATSVKVCCSRPGQRDCPRPARGRRADGGKGGLRFQLAVDDRHRHLPGGDRLRILAGHRAAALRSLVPGDLPSHALAAVHDRLHAGHRLHDALQRHGRHAGPGLHAHGAGLSVVRRAAGLAGRGADRLGHFVERLVRQPADDHGRPS